MLFVTNINAMVRDEVFNESIGGSMITLIKTDSYKLIETKANINKEIPWQN